MPAALTLTLVPPDTVALGQFALGVLARAVTEALRKSVAPVQVRAALLLREALNAAPATASLRNGELQHKLGINNADSVLEAIFKAIVNGMSITVRDAQVSSLSFQAGMTVGVLVSDFAELLVLPEASYVSENGYRVPWLKWLLTEGVALVIADRDYLGGFVELSRTEYGIMAKRKNPRGFSVPALYAGSPADNWLTRALLGKEEDIALIMVEEFQRALA